jgi:hypothetical protein
VTFLLCVCASNYHGFVVRQVSVGISPSQIAVISPYQAQVTLLASLLRPKYGLVIEIGTVDGMQGREKEAIIISLVRSNDTVCLLRVLLFTFVQKPAERSRIPQREAQAERGHDAGEATFGMKLRSVSIVTLLMICIVHRG